MKKQQLFISGFIVLFIALMSMALNTPNVYASCAAPPSQVQAMEGKWKNINANTPGLTKVNIFFVCNDHMACPVPGSCTPSRGSGEYLQVYQACNPQDCDWGETEVTYNAGRGYLVGTYDYGLLMRYLFVDLMQGGSRDGQLRVRLITQYKNTNPPVDAPTLTFYFQREVTVTPVSNPQNQGLTKLYSWWNPVRGDNFASTNSYWSGPIGTAKEGYTLYRIEGKIFNPSRSQPAGTVPLYSWWNPARGDNFASTNPYWSGPIGTAKEGYTLYRLEGYVYPK